MGALLQGDLGYSFSHRRPVLEVIGQILPNTILLSTAALAVAFTIGVLIGIVQSVRQYSLADQALSVLALFFYSMPSFWLALMLILVFALFARNVWEWPIYFPPSGTRSVDAASLGPLERVLDRLRYMVLPVTSLALVLSAGIARYTRGSMLEVIRQDYVRTARAKGLPERAVILKHTLRNALIPVITLLGLYLPVLFSGTVFIETVFGWPGMGKTIVDAIAQRDYPLVMGTSLIFGAMVVAGNLVADLLYALVDPRIRYD
jgi:peptide/nickel transport system permease protein